jgi:hypothetical protein
MNSAKLRALAEEWFKVRHVCARGDFPEGGPMHPCDGQAWRIFNAIAIYAGSGRSDEKVIEAVGRAVFQVCGVVRQAQKRRDGHKSRPVGVPSSFLKTPLQARHVVSNGAREGRTLVGRRQRGTPWGEPSQGGTPPGCAGGCDQGQESGHEAGRR